MAHRSIVNSLGSVALPSARPTRVEFTLTDRTFLTLSVRDGDLLRSDCGSIWITRDGHLRDVVLSPGDGHRLQGDARLHVSGFGAARLTVFPRSPR